MHTLKTVSEAAQFRRGAHTPLIFVPTMGALHRGHEALIRDAKERAGANGTVVVSIFVNPSQFGPKEDFTQYPRPLNADLDLCRSLGVDAVFMPDVDELYPPGDSTVVEEIRLSSGLCGRWRPGHFRGVCTIVAKLFQILRPGITIFGEKDYQQLAVIRRMARDLFFPVEIIGHPTVREPDGLALSSRNRYLTPDERKAAAHFPAALQTAKTLAAEGEIRADRLLARVREAITEGTGAAPQYLELVDAENLDPLEILNRPAVLAAALIIGRTRLIDNILIEPAHANI